MIESLGEGASILRCFADEAALIQAVHLVAEGAPFRHMTVPGGFQMSVAMTNCGPLGWVSDATGYRYEPHDPLTGKPWPAMPPVFIETAGRAAETAGFANFAPDACLINRYEPGAKMGLHQDKDEVDFLAPIVSVSLGLPATFLWGGNRRKEPVQRMRLESGDIVVWGGPARKTYHGIAPLPKGEHPLTGAARFNLTFRKAR